MRDKLKILLREGLLGEGYELLPYYDDVDLSEYGIDEYEAADMAHEIAKDGGVKILSDKELNGILIDTQNSVVIGGLWVSNDTEKYSFDIALDSNYQNLGISSYLINAAIEEFNYQKDVYGDELVMEVDVINPKLAEILTKKYGFTIVGHLGADRVLMTV